MCESLPSQASNGQYVAAAAALLTVLVAGFIPSSAHAEDSGVTAEGPLVREIFVPFEDLSVLLEGQAERVFLTRDEYEELLAKAARSPADHAPRAVLPLRAHYEATIAGGRATIRGAIDIDVLEPGLHPLPLELAGVGIRSASLDGRAAPLARADDGRALLFVAGRGRRQLELELVTPLHTSAAQQSLNVQLPMPPATRFHLEVPGNVEIRSGAAVASRSVDEAAGVTRFELVPRRGPLTLVMSLNNRLLLQQSVVAARGVVVDEVTQAYERLHATFSLNVLHGAVDRFRFKLPDGFAVSNVATPLLSRWIVRETDDRSRVLEVTLQEPTSDMVVINIAATDNSVQMDPWIMPRMEPLDVNSHVGVIGLLLEDRLDANSVHATELVAIDTQVLRGALPDSVFQMDPGAPRVRPVVAYYAAQPDYELQANFVRPAARVSATTNVLLILGDKQQEVQAHFVLQLENEKLFAADVHIPPGWSVSSVMLDDGSPLVFERFVPAVDGRARVQVLLPQGIPPGSLAHVVLKATYTSADWLEQWKQHALRFPVFSVRGASEERGAIAIQTNDDLMVRPTELSGLTPLDQEEKKEFGLDQLRVNLAYRYESQPYQATCTIERVQPLVTARTYSFLKLEPQGLSAYYEVIYGIERARTPTLSLRLPSTTPAALSIRGLDGVQVKEFTSEVAEGYREWSVQLADRRDGPVRLAIDFQQRFDSDEPSGYALPLIEAQGVAYQTAVAAVEGSAEFDIELQTNGRPIDVGELIDADYEVGKRLLGVFELAGDDLSVDVDIFRRPGYGLPAALVQRAELVTLVSTAGIAQTAARYQLRTKAAYLQVVLPAKATLWSATVDGSPSSPQREGDSLLLSLPPAAGNPLRDVQLVYELPVANVNFLGEIETTAPQLVVRGATDESGYEVPVADVQWHLVLPDGHQVVRTGGSVFLTQQKPRVSPAAVVGAVLYDLAGGIGPWYRTSRSRPGPTSSPTFMMQDGAVEFESQTMSERRFRLHDMAGMGSDEGAEEPAAELYFAAPGGEDDEAAASKTGEAAPIAGVPLQRSSTPDSEEPAVQSESGGDKYWALEGVRSLQIALDRTGTGLTFRSMGVAPALNVTMIDANRLRFASWLLALLVALVGLLATGSTLRVRASFVISAMIAALALPAIAGWYYDLDLSATFDLAFYAACLLVPYYLLVGCLKWIVGKFTPTAGRLAAAASAGMLLVCLFSSPAVLAQGDLPVEAGDLLRLIDPPEPIKLPADAVIIPYDAEDEAGTQSAEKVLVPYSQYVNLWNRAYPDKPIGVKPPPASYALAGARYETTLVGGDHLLVLGEMEFDIYDEKAVEIPLRLEGGVLTEAALDGESARIRVVSSAVQPPQRAARQVASAARPLVVVYAEGKGRRRFEFSIRVPLQRSGGWRIARAQLPAAPSTAVSLLVPTNQTEVRLAGVQDLAAYETSRDNQSIESALGPDGSFSVQWRPKVAVGQIDRTLTARSTAVFDIQEDGQRLTWQVQLSFRRSQRETFTVSAPASYLVEGVTGDNVRGWQAKPQGETQRLEITLLKAATGKESFTVTLSRHDPIANAVQQELDVPVVGIPDAALQQGILTLRRSPLLEVRTQDAAGLNRADAGDATSSKLLAGIRDESPLGIRPFQAFRFSSASFALRLSVRHYAARVAAHVQSLVKIAQRETTYEARIELDIQDRPLFQVQAYLPDDLQLQDVEAPAPFEWAVTSTDNRQLLTLQLQSAQQGSVPIVVRGRLPQQEVNRAVSVPRIEVIAADRQSGYVVVQADPAYEVRAEDLRNCDSVLLRRVHDWLDAGQRQLARLALHYRSADFDASLRTVARQPRVNGFTITNVRVTPREVQETIFLQLTILDAGIREVSFRLPASLRDARVTAPMLRQKTVSDIDDDANQVLVRLELQDDVIDQLIVVVQQDRPLTKDVQAAAIPMLETGQVDQQFVVLESAGRDEVVVEAVDGLRELNRQEAEWRKLHNVLGTRITHAYLASDSSQQLQLRFRMMARSTVETAGARIRMSETLLMVDGHGAYRASQTYSVDNRTEQFLEIRLPAGALLWTAKVDGHMVKPTQVPGAANDRLVRVPLIKTVTGDLDYPVELKYGGRIMALSGFKSVEFPLARAVNINVEQSQVRLRLPESHRWFNFGGSMKLVSEGDLLADFLDYKTKQIQELRRVLSSSANEFSKVRARSNLKQLGLALKNYQAEYGDVRNERLSRSLLGNNSAWRAAEQEIERGKQGLDKEPVTDNRGRLVELGESQVTNRSTNIVNQLESNFDAAAVPEAEEMAPKRSYFNHQWLEGNQLDNARVEQLDKSVSRLADRLGKPQQPLAKGAVRFSRDAKKANKAFAEQIPIDGLERGQRQMQQRASGLKEQVERYEQKLQQENFQALPSANAVADQPQSGQALLGTQRGWAYQDGELADPDVQSGLRGTVAAGVVSQRSAGLSSLDVALTERGVEYLFTTPRGDIEITAQAINSKQVDRAYLLAGIFGCLCAGLAIVWLGRYLNRRLSHNARAVLLIVTGCISLVGFFPIVGAVAIAAGIFLLIRGTSSEVQFATAD